MTITNLGPGPAIDLSLDVTHSRGVDGSTTYRGPEIAVAYRGPRAAEGQTPSNPILPDCRPTNDSSTVRYNCQIRLVLQPGEMLQVHYKWIPCPTGTVPIAPPPIRISTTDELPGSEHAVNIYQACRL